MALLVAINPFVSATSGGDPYSVPLVTDTNPAPNIVETTLTAEEATVEIGKGVQAHAQTFNGQIPGPTFVLNVGDTVIVHYQNHLQRVSGIHWHGIELANDMDGTPFTQNQVPPGGTFLYKFTVTRPGIFWYHPHHHSSTNQVFKGLYGMILVKDPNEAALQKAGILPPESQTRPIVLSDITVCKKKGSNDAATYNPALPHVAAARLPLQEHRRRKTSAKAPTVAASPTHTRSTKTANCAAPSKQATSRTSRPSSTPAGPTRARRSSPTAATSAGGRANPKPRARSKPVPRRSTYSPDRGCACNFSTPPRSAISACGSPPRPAP